MAPTTDLADAGGPFDAIVLDLEDAEPVIAPEAGAIKQALDALAPPQGPAFLVLDRNDGAFAQVAGGPDLFVAEWHEAALGGFTHFRAGHEPVSTRQVDVPTSRGFVVTCLDSEVLTRDEALSILLAFAAESPMPAAFHWRDMTDEVAGQHPAGDIAED